MGLEAPDRSPLGAFYRSPLQARATGVGEGPEPPEIEPVDGCCFTWARVEPYLTQTCSSSLACNGITAVGNSSQKVDIVSLTSTWSYKNFPIGVRARDGQTRAYPWGCPPQDWTNFAVRYAESESLGWVYIPFLSGGLAPEMSIRECGDNIEALVADEVCIIEAPSAEWTILDIPQPNQIEVGFNKLGDKALIRIIDNGPNDGEWRVAQDSGQGDLIYLTENLPDPSSTAGKVLLVLSVYKLVVFYDAVADPPGGLYPAFMETTGTFNVADSRLALSDAAPYNGVHAVTHISDTRVELDVNFNGRVSPGGSWINEATVLTVPAGASHANARLRVVGTIGIYDKDYEGGEWSTQGSDLLLFDTFFQGTDSGTVHYSGVGLNLVNGPPSTFYQGLVIVTGTGLYDGSYPDTFVLIQADGTGQAFLSTPFFAGTATGVLSIPELSETADIVSAEEDLPAQSFTAASAQRTGDIASILPEKMRVATEQVGQWALGQDAVLISDDEQGHPYGFGGRPIALVGIGFIDVEGVFTVTDTGGCGIKKP